MNHPPARHSLQLAGVDPHRSVADEVRIMAGRPDQNASLMRRIGLPLGDPAAWIAPPGGPTVGIVRDLEQGRTVAAGRCGVVTHPAACPLPPGRDRQPVDRETAVAAALAGYLTEQSIGAVTADRTLPLVFAWELAAAGIAIDYDEEMGVTDRRAKKPDEIEALADVQRKTETVMRHILQTIATAAVDDQGQLIGPAGVLTSESLRREAAIEFLKLDCTMNHGAIIAGPPHAGDCHHAGTGPLFSGVPYIIDLFPRDQTSRYHGDCTRTVVHGDVTAEVAAMHAAVIAAKNAAVDGCRVGQTADRVHSLATEVLTVAGYREQRGEISDEPTIQHGTGHGVGLDLHEPILVDRDGLELLEGEVLTIEPGLYGRRTGGVRIEDMIVVTTAGPRNLNSLPVGLDWAG